MEIELTDIEFKAFITQPSDLLDIEAVYYDEVEVGESNE